MTCGNFLASTFIQDIRHAQYVFEFYQSCLARPDVKHLKQNFASAL